MHSRVSDSGKCCANDPEIQETKYKKIDGNFSAFFKLVLASTSGTKVGSMM